MINSQPRLRTLALMATLAFSLALAIPGSAAAALGTALHINGSTNASVVQGGTVELTWVTTDADTATAWTHQGGTPVTFTTWDGAKSVGPANHQTVTVDLPPGTYTLVIEASSGAAPAISSVGLTVLPNTSDDDDDGDDAVIIDDPDAQDTSDPAGDIPTVAPRAGLP